MYTNMCKLWVGWISLVKHIAHVSYPTHTLTQALSC